MPVAEIAEIVKLALNKPISSIVMAIKETVTASEKHIAEMEESFDDIKK